MSRRDDDVHGKTGRPLLADVARLAGVSSQSASRILRGSGSHSAATSRRVLAAAAALGYRADDAASTLARRRSGQPCPRPADLAEGPWSEIELLRHLAARLLQQDVDPHAPLQAALRQVVSACDASLTSRLDERRAAGL